MHEKIQRRTFNELSTLNPQLPTKKGQRLRKGNLTFREKKRAPTYSPTSYRSTIGAGGLNFSVRNGKRWDTAAVGTRVCLQGQTRQAGTGGRHNRGITHGQRARNPDVRKIRAISSARL